MTQGNGGQFYIGIIEDRNDPLMVGRVKCRVVGLHTHDKTVLPTADLPWAMLMQPAQGGVTKSSLGPVEGTTCIVVFNDWPECQQPIVIGVLNGVPQTTSVNVDKFEDTPLFKDDITPQGRPIPRSSAESTGNHVGPITGQSVSPALMQAVQQGQQQAETTRQGVIETTLSPASHVLGGVGGLTGSVGGIGSIYGGATNTFEDLLQETGNKDAAFEQFQLLAASSSGDVGNTLANVLQGVASLSNAMDQLGVGVNGLQSVFSTITTGLQGSSQKLFENVEQAFQSGFASNVESPLTILSNFTSANQDIEGLASISLTGFTPADQAASQVSLPDEITLTSPTAETYVSLLSDEFASSSLLADDVGSISTIVNVSVGELDASAFEGVEQGITPPVYGAFGGPNFGGGSAPIETPTIDYNKYEGGSTASIPTTPPPDWPGNRGLAEEGIKALLKACDKYKFNTNEQRAALLGIVGAESGWIPTNESAQYTRPERLCEVFASTFKGRLPLAEQYCNWIKGNKGTREQFFDFVYDPANNGRELGNTNPGDGGKFYGRGFIQLTGRANYERYAKLSGYPIDKTPDLLVTDFDISAEIAVLYLMDRVSKGAVPTSHPGYFYAAKKSVGKNTPDIAARKLSYYEYFYGTKTPESYQFAEKQAGNALSPYSYHGAVVGNEQGLPQTHGFVDPHGKYPLKRYNQEPEINRLARGVIKDTVVPLKQSKRVVGVPIANNGGFWDQPPVPYGTKYPYNNVMETESGHLEEWDDTPGYERMHRYHRTGTFEEIDANGTRVVRVVGDQYTIIDRNGFISIEGTANLTVDGNVNIFCRSNANVEVAGSAEMKVGGNFNVGVARDMNIAVEGNFSLWANGSMNLQSAKKAHVLSKDNAYISSNKQLHMTSDEGLFVETFESVNLNALQNVNVTTGAEISLYSGADTKITSTGSTQVLASGNVDVDGTLINLNTGTASEGNKADPATKALIHGMVPPPTGTPLYTEVEPLSPPPTLGEEKFMYEIPEEGQTPLSRAYNTERTTQEGKQNSFQSEVVPPAGNQQQVTVPPTINNILATAEFTADFRLSKHFTLGMLFDGGFNVRHKLIDQNGLTKQQIVANLAALCENVLEPYLTKLPDGIAGYGKKWRITSGYRMGTNTSDHSKGRACDIALIGGLERKQLHHQLIQELDRLVPYDQLILEYEGKFATWIHTSFRGSSGEDTFGGGVNRKQAFTMNDHKTHGPGFILLG